LQNFIIWTKFLTYDLTLEFDYELATNLVLVVLPTVIGIIGSKLLVNSWQIRKEKFALRKDILVNFQETWPLASSIIFDLYLKISSEYSTIKPNAKIKNGKIDVEWFFPTIESEKPFNKFNEDFKKMDGQLSLTTHKGSGFRGLIVLYFKTSETILDLFDNLKEDISEYIILLNHMILSKNLDELLKANFELLQMRTKVKEKIHILEKILIETKLKNPKT